MSSSTLIEAAEVQARAAFRIFDSKATSIRANCKPATESDSLSELILKSSQQDPRVQHNEIEHEFNARIKSALANIETGLAIAQDYERAADYLIDASEPPVDESLRQYCEQAKSAANLGSGSVDLHALSRDIKRNIAGARDELERVRRVWSERTKSAAVVALRGKRFILSTHMGYPDARVQEAKLKAVQVMHDRKFGTTRRSRTEIAGAR